MGCEIRESNSENGQPKKERKIFVSRLGYPAEKAGEAIHVAKRLGQDQTFRVFRVLTASFGNLMLTPRYPLYIHASCGAAG